MAFKDRFIYDSKTDLIGKGGFSRVYKAYDKKYEMFIALKRYYSSGNFDERYCFSSEIKKAIRLNHPNLIRYYDSDSFEITNELNETEIVEYCTMELADMGDFRSFLATKPDDPSLKKIICDILNGLSYLHSQNIIHRDLKPSNILLKSDNNNIVAKISDFNISKQINTDHSVSNYLVGSVEFMAPEQFDAGKFGIDGAISTNVDLWSFGIILYGYFTKTLPFGNRKNGDVFDEIRNNILLNDVPEIPETIPEPYKKIISLCLIKEASNRIQTANELLNLLTDQIFQNENLKPDENTTNIIFNKTNQFEHTILINNHDGVKQGKKKNYKKIIVWFIIAVIICCISYFFIPNFIKKQKEADKIRIEKLKKDSIALVNEKIKHQDKLFKLKEDSLRKIILKNIKTGIFTDKRDNQKYDWVKIGDQVWMAENLNYFTKKSWVFDTTLQFKFTLSEFIADCRQANPQFSDLDDNTFINGFFQKFPDNKKLVDFNSERKQSLKSFNKNGRIYSHSIINEVCPEGWHIPSLEEVEVLMSNCKDTTGRIYNNLKSGSPYNFNVMPGSNFWTSSNEKGNPWIFVFHYFNGNLGATMTFNNGKSNKFCIRCIKDNNTTNDIEENLTSDKNNWFADTRSNVIQNDSNSFDINGYKFYVPKFKYEFYTYKTVKINGKIWMAENLKYRLSKKKFDKNSKSKLSVDVQLYGEFYTWEEAINACPEGWRLATKNDFKSIIKNDEMQSYWALINGGEIGFNALLLGYKESKYDDFLSGAHFWAADENNEKKAWHLYLDESDHKAKLEPAFKKYGFNVRCVEK